MTPLERFEADLAKLQNSGCTADSTTQRASEEYKSQAAEASRQLREKQKQEREKRGWI